MEITKREILVSFAIMFLMLTVGFVISGKIIDAENDKNAEYQKALQIENSELFKYGMETNAGNAFVYGELKAVDPVTYEEIGGEYLYITKVKERYERNERQVTEKGPYGEKITKTEVYYDWETEKVEQRNSKTINFCGVDFPYKKIPYRSDRYIKTINSDKEYSFESGEYVKVRFAYYGTPVKHIGTIYTTLKDGTISDNSSFSNNYTIEQALGNRTYRIWSNLFKIFWLFFTGVCICGFCYLENDWLEE